MVDYGGDFTVIYWISEYLHCSIHIWNFKNGWIIVKIKQENTPTPLNLVYGNNHFEPDEINSKITNIPIHIHNDDQK
jgi:hypothetical protein